MSIQKRAVAFCVALALLFVTAPLIKAYADEVIVRAKLEKEVYAVDEPVNIKLEVENVNGGTIIPGTAAVLPGLGSYTGNLGFTLYKLVGGDYSMVINPGRYSVVGRGNLRPILVGVPYGAAQQFSIPTRSAAIVGDGEVFDRLKDNNIPDKTGCYLIRVHFLGKNKGVSVSGYAVTTFTIKR